MELPSFLKNKTPAERNKIIAAMVLGFLSVAALFYTFVLSGGSSSPKTASVKPTPTPTASPKMQLPTPAEARNENPLAYLDLLPENPFPPVVGDAPARNIFAIYEPPPPAPPKPPPSPTPPPPLPSPSPPAFLLAGVNPMQTFARTGDFTMDVSGDKFTNDARILFNGVEVPTQFISPQQLRAQVPAALVANAGQAQIFVRTPDGQKISNNTGFIIQQPPTPNYNFVGLVARKRSDNDSALLQNKANNKEYKNVRLGETVDNRFQIVSISSREVVFLDTALKLRYNVPFFDEKIAARTSSTGPTNNPNRPNNGFPPGIDPNVQYQQLPPGFNQIPQPIQQPPPDEDDNSPNN